MEVRRDCAIEFTSPGPSPLRYAQGWAQRAVDRPEGERLPPYEEQLDPEPPTDISFALGIALGRFGPTRGNIHRFDANTLRALLAEHLARRRKTPHRPHQSP